MSFKFNINFTSTNRVPDNSVIVVPVFQSDLVADISDSVLNVLQNFSEKSSATLDQKVLQRGSFKGNLGDITHIPCKGLPNDELIVVVGLGEEEKFDNKQAIKFGQTLHKHIKLYKDVFIVPSLNNTLLSHIADGIIYASYEFKKYKTRDDDKIKQNLSSITFFTSDAADAKSLYQDTVAMSHGISFARDLGNEVANVLIPLTYADRIKKELEPLGVKVQILKEKELESRGLRTLLSVGKGSQHDSCVVIMEWNNAVSKNADPLVLVGKGVTFDTGGISLKPSRNMEEMKFDMCGSSAVVGTMLSLAKKKSKSRVVGLVGLVENSVGSKANKPGDVIKSMDGAYVEILNTDAEGRLVLIDLLTLAQTDYKCKAIIDFATLTGAVIVALGSYNAGLFSNDDKLSNQIMSSGHNTGESSWRLPMSDEYEKMIDSKIADFQNINVKDSSGASSITAAHFLKKVVKNNTPWAHIDIAGVAWKSGTNSCTGFGVRLITDFVKKNYEGK